MYITENIFQTYSYDAYYCTIFVPGKTAERGIETDEDDCILNTFYGDKCYDIWVTLGYAFFSKSIDKSETEKIRQNMIESGQKSIELVKKRQRLNIGNFIEEQILIEKFCCRRPQEHPPPVILVPQVPVEPEIKIPIPLKTKKMHQYGTLNK